jgi:hypothetical protein
LFAQSITLGASLDEENRPGVIESHFQICVPGTGVRTHAGDGSYHIDEGAVDSIRLRSEPNPEAAAKSRVSCLMAEVRGLFAVTAGRGRSANPKKSS